MDRFEDIVRRTISHLKFRQDYRPIHLYSNELQFSAQAGPLEPDVISYELPTQEVPEEIQVRETIAPEATIKPTMAEKTTELVPAEIWTESQNLAELEAAIKDCQKCKLWKTRTNFVFGSGNPNADIVVVGEAPGAEEDKQGLPFVGRAGQLLTKILEAVELKRDEVFICNILKSRPPENRNPAPDEIEACEPYLIKQLQLINPKLILALGTFASQTLLKTKLPLGKLRGRFHDYNGIKTMVTFHPAALLRNPGWKKDTWEDVKLLRAEYDKMVKK